MFGFYLEEYLYYNFVVLVDLKWLVNDVKFYVKFVKDDDIEVFFGYLVNVFLFVWWFLMEWRNIVDKLDEINLIGLGNY